MNDKHYSKIAQAISNAIEEIGYSQTLGLVETIKVDMQTESIKDYLEEHLNNN